MSVQQLHVITNDAVNKSDAFLNKNIGAYNTVGYLAVLFNYYIVHEQATSYFGAFYSRTMAYNGLVNS